MGAGEEASLFPARPLADALFWLRVYTTYEVMGFFYELDKTNIEDNTKDILATLDTMTTLTYDRPGRERKKLRSAGEVMDAFSSEHNWVVRIVAGLVNRRIAERPLKLYAAGEPKG